MNKSKLTCIGCEEVVHICPQCPQNPLGFRKSASNAQGQKVGFCFKNNTPKKFMASRTINGARVTSVLRDIGHSLIIVLEAALPDIDLSM